MTEEILLASKSPRRRELLSNAGVKFSVEVSDAEENYDPLLPPGEIVKTLSRIKAEAVAKNHPDQTILGADTIVVLDGEILGKPKDEADARRMLHLLSGRTHEVYTGVTILRGRRKIQFFERTKVTFFRLSDEEIASYVATGEPMDKAGAYGIQLRGARFVRRISGDYATVVGLPVARTIRALERLERRTSSGQ